MSSRRWFHPNISGVDAEQLLLEKGCHGSFLCRPSSSNPGDFTLSVRRGEYVTHIKIHNNGDCYDLYGGDPFATLSELVQYYMEHQLKEKTGEIIDLKYPMYSEDPTTERWFHGHMSGKEAERLLLDRGKNGSYLVRESISRPGDYALTLRNNDKIFHVMIRNVDGKYDIGGGPNFDSLTELVEYYRKNAMVEKAGGSVVHLKQPFHATRITASTLGERVRELQKEISQVPGKTGFWEEFEQLQQQEFKHLYSRKEGVKPENKLKNRYKNILPFDHRRVKLKDREEGVEGNDYINASYIDGESRATEKQYIATQGCLPSTIVDFWRMVYQEQSRIVLMTTREMERGRSKCAKYWPDLNESLQTGKFTVTNQKEEVFSEHILREFRLQNNEKGSEEPRVIYHYQFTGWPEHGVPPHPGTTILILRNIKRLHRDFPDAGPTIVHCSAGIGRTGIMIVIDILMNVIQKQGIDSEIDIQRTVQLVRSQRSGMVQTENQFKFIYLAIQYFVEEEKRQLQLESQFAATEVETPAVLPSRTGRPPLSPGDFIGDDEAFSYNPEEVSLPTDRVAPPPVPSRLTQHRS